MTSQVGSNVNTSTGIPSTAKEALDDTFDDACDFGQCCMDPCYFLYVKTRALWQRRVLQQRKNKTITESTVEDQRKRRYTKALRMFALQQTTYLMLIGGCWTIIFWRVYPLIDASRGISSYHKTAGYAVFIACITSWLWAKYTSPGSITRDTLWKFDNYQYDGVLYHAPPSTLEQSQQPYITEDATTNASYQKLARSKFDRYSGHQVPRFDHFCGWLGQSIGEENYRCFLVFVTIHTIMVLYGTTLVVLLMSDVGKVSLTNPVDSMTGATDMRGGDQTMSALDVFWAALRVDAWVVLTNMLMGISLPFLVTLLSFHVLLLRRGMTTNEHFKWKARQVNKQHTHARHISMGDIDHATCSRNGNSTIQLSTPSSSLSTSLLAQQQQFYNLGFAGNLHEVLFPRSLRRGGVKRV